MTAKSKRLIAILGEQKEKPIEHTVIGVKHFINVFGVSRLLID